MLDGFPGTHIEAHFATCSEQSVSGQTRNGEEINAGFLEEYLAHVDSTADARARIAGFGSRRGVIVSRVRIAIELRDDGRFAVGDLALVGLVQLSSLAQGKQMFVAIIANQRLGDGLAAAVTTAITVGR